METKGTELAEHEDGSALLVNKLGDIFLPPFPGTPERVEKLKSLKLRDDDLLVISYPKSGTHWVWNLMALLLNKDAAKKENFEFPIPYLLERHEQEEYANDPSPRILTSHLPPQYLPEINNVKVIYITRNPKDVLVSFWHILKHYPGMSASLNATVQWFWDKCSFITVPYGDWFVHNETYRSLSQKNKQKFCMLVYEDMKRDPHASVKIIADFLEVEVTDDEIELFLDMTSVSKRKQFFEDQKDLFETQFYRKGVVGDWKNHFTVAMNEDFDARYNERVKDTELRWTFE